MKKAIKKKSVMKKPAGRPKIALDLEKVEELARICDSKEDIARILGVSMDTLNRREKESADFADAIKRGQSRAMEFVCGKLHEAIGEGNVTAMIFYLKCHGWRETNRTELTGADGGAVKTEQLGALSNAELLAIAGLNADDEAVEDSNSRSKKRAEKKSS